MTTGKISIELSEDEVLVLFEWLHRVNESPQTEFEDQAEQRAAWDLEAALETANPALFAGDYTGCACGKPEIASGIRMSEQQKQPSAAQGSAT